jgi:hypothetical protein
MKPAKTTAKEHKSSSPLNKPHTLDLRALNPNDAPMPRFFDDIFIAF